MSDIKDIMVSRYLPYAEETIINRAIPYIDGLKPVQRKILYAMYELGLTKGGRKKCARIVGDTMGKYHPHGDASIYDALCSMGESYEGFNAPLIKGQGNLGKSWSNPKLPGGIKPAQMRYSEAGLEPIASGLFEGLNEDAVDMIPNFDESETEPALLPTKFPNILINSNKGVAVGFASYIPSYTVAGACNAVAKVLRGQVKSAEDLVETLGAPEFPVGGTIHTDRALLLQLLNTGKATFVVTGTMHRSGDDIVIDSVPMGVSFEKVTAQLMDLAKSNDGKEIVDIISNVGLKSTGILVKVKKGTNLKALALKIYQKTSVRDTVSFCAQVIVNGELKQLSVMQLIDEWIKFRSQCVKRVYTRRALKMEETEHKASAWEIVYDRIPEMVKMMTSCNEETALVKLKEDFGLDDVQAEYLLNLKIKSICVDRAIKELESLKKIREELGRIRSIRDDEAARYSLIASELDEVAMKFGVARACKVDELVPEEEKASHKPAIPDTMTTVFITKRGLIKCIHDMVYMNEAKRYMTEDDELLVPPVYVKLNDTMLMYTYSGYCYKIPVVDIESSRTGFKQYFWDLVERKDKAPLLYACEAAGYDKQFTVIYGHGRGRIVRTADVSGRQKAYKNCFLPGNNIRGSKDRIFIVPFQRFYMITKNKKAAYGNTKYLCTLSTRTAFKVARTTDSDPIMWFLNADNVKESEFENDKYCKGYCVKAVDAALVEAIETFLPKELRPLSKE